MEKTTAFSFGDTEIAAGTRTAVDLPISRVSSGQIVSLPVRIVHGRKPGPVLFVSAAIHGDEITGVEVARRLLKRISPRTLSGTLLCVPVVNVYGFVGNSRYLPDRRDLNRSFPGVENGSLASRLAYIFRTQIIERADFGIDLHSAAVHRMNLPQIRVSAGSEKAQKLALSFGAPVVITSPLRENSLRKVAMEAGVEMLLYEAGEALRFDEFSIRTGLNGIMRVMCAMGMLQSRRLQKPSPDPAKATRSTWVRAPRGGICIRKAKSGDIVSAGDILGMVANPVGDDEDAIIAPIDGLIIGDARMPIVNRGDALFHIAKISGLEAAGERVDEITESILSDQMLDEDEVM